MSFNFKEVYSLKQHTPLLHFQYKQDAATLRATELKPSLDHLVIERVSGLQGEEAQNHFRENHSHWLVGGGHNEHYALDYKIHIRARTKTEYLVSSSIPRYRREEYTRDQILFISGAPFFADNEPIKNRKLEEARRGVMYENVELEITCLDELLMKHIRSALPALFTFHNFGLRQSKGFGCFSLSSTTKQDFEDLLTLRYPKALLYEFKKSSPSLQQIFKKIDNEYKILKSGFAKDPSQLNEYFKENYSIEWEKPVIKRELVKGRGVPSGKDYSKDRKYQYIRALLGVAELYEFPRDRKKINIKSAETDTIERMRSPLTFKVFDGTIYLLNEGIPDGIYGKQFCFSNGLGCITLSTPSSDIKFELDDFLNKHLEESWIYVRED